MCTTLEESSKLHYILLVSTKKSTKTGKIENPNIGTYILGIWVVEIGTTIKRIKVGIGITWNKQHPNDYSKLSEREIPHNTTWHWK